MENKTAITVEAIINAPIEKVWAYWTEPVHIIKWYYASDDWHAPYADNDVRVNGNFKTTMAAKDGSMSFDFGGVYTNVVLYKLLEYTINDGRKVRINFSQQEDETLITETFEAETIHSYEMQKSGWQAILNNFKNYVEASVKEKPLK